MERRVGSRKLIVSEPQISKVLRLELPRTFSSIIMNEGGSETSSTKGARLPNLRDTRSARGREIGASRGEIGLWMTERCLRRGHERRSWRMKGPRKSTTGRTSMRREGNSRLPRSTVPVSFSEEAELVLDGSKSMVRKGRSDEKYDALWKGSMDCMTNENERSSGTIGGESCSSKRERDGAYEVQSF